MDNNIAAELSGERLRHINILAARNVSSQVRSQAKPGQSRPATGSDQGLLGMAVLVLMVGIVLLAMSISIRREQIPSDAAGPFGKFT